MGEYTVLRRMAVGGMAEIFLGRRDGMSGFEKLVVLKRILPHFAHNHDFVRMFLNEARIAATLHHPNVVQVHNIGEEAGQYFFAMEFLHGEDLSRVLSRATASGRPVSLDSVLTILIGVCAGLHYAHERRAADGRPLGIVHRDVSPHNVFVTYEGGVKLLDFGIAKATTSIGKTRTGVLKGKVAYMSPEQAYSQPVDRRSDVFCIGILLWELTTGRRLYRRRSELETLKALVDEDAPAPSTIVWGYPTELERILMKCLCRDPGGRWATCEELGLALEAFARSQAVQVSPQIAARMMHGLFDAEITQFREAIESGGSLVEHIVSRIEATASRSSVDDWEDIDSVIVDMGAIASAVEAATTTEITEERPTYVAPDLSDTFTEPSVDLPRPAPALRPLPGVTPAPVIAPAPVLAQPLPAPELTPAPIPVRPGGLPLPPPPSMPPAVAALISSARAVTPYPPASPYLAQVAASEPVALEPFEVADVAPRRARRPLLWLGAAAAVLGAAVGVFVATRGDGGSAAPPPEAPAPEVALPPAPPPAPVPAAEPAEEPAAVVAPVVAPPPVVASPPPPPPPVADPPPRPAAIATQGDRVPAKAERRPPARPRPRPRATPVKRPETKAADRTVPARRPPTKKDLDSLPI
jgi:serine/threonine protein kinase